MPGSPTACIYGNHILNINSEKMNFCHRSTVSFCPGFRGKMKHQSGQNEIIIIIIIINVTSTTQTQIKCSKCAMSTFTGVIA